MTAKCSKCGLSVNSDDPVWEKSFIADHQKEAHKAAAKAAAAKPAAKSTAKGK